MVAIRGCSRAIVPEDFATWSERSWKHAACHCSCACITKSWACMYSMAFRSCSCVCACESSRRAWRWNISLIIAMPDTPVSIDVSFAVPLMSAHS